MTTRDGTGRSGSFWAPAIVLAALYWLLVGPVIASGRGGPSEAKDQDRHHLVVIETMLNEWPDVDIVNYASATSPGYHFALAAINRAISGATINKPALRWSNALLSFALLLAVYALASRRIRPEFSAVLCLPLLASPYFLGAAIFLTTDNAALFFVCIALGGAVFLARRPASDLAIGVSAMCAVGIRQIHAWIAGPIGLAGLLASPLALRLPLARQIAGPDPLRLRNLIVGAIAGLTPLALLAVFVALWGGLMPPAYVDMHNSGVNLATPAFALALVGAFGVFFAPLWSIDWRALARSRVFWAAIAIGAVVAAACPTSYAPQQRAYGALWKLIARTPAVGERSLLLAALAVLGSVIVTAIARAASARGATREIAVLFLSMLGWMLAQSFNSMAWQRYFEPMALIFLCWATALGAAPEATAKPRRWLGVAALVAGLGFLSALSLYREVIEAGAPG